MSYNCYIDLNLNVKQLKLTNLKFEITPTAYSFTANLGKLQSIKAMEDVLLFRFEFGDVRVDITFDDLYKFLVKNSINKRIGFEYNGFTKRND